MPKATARVLEYYFYFLTIMSVTFRGSEKIILKLALMNVIQQSSIILASGSTATVKGLSLFIFHYTYAQIP